MTSPLQSGHQCKTTCPYCGVGCGVSATVRDNQIIAVSGDPDHPANKGKLCVKGSALHEVLGYEGRLLAPRINGLTSDWDSALTLVAQRFAQTIAEHGPNAVAFYVSGQLLTEDYYVANKLMKGFIGSANIDTNSRLCMASPTLAHKRAFGEDLVPGCYEDLELAELIILVGSNTAFAHPIVFQRIVQAKIDNPKLQVVVLDPRYTPTCEAADLHLQLRPGSDAYFFNALLVYLADNDYLNQVYIEEHCDGLEQALSAARTNIPDMATAAQHCDLALEDMLACFALFAQHERVVTLFSQGINQSVSGVDKGNAITNCHLATGKIGYPGAMPFAITGQPNAMGGREVGGLANQLAAHTQFENPDDVALVREFWQAPNLATQQGLKAVDMFEAVGQGKIKAIWIMATNPVISMPQASLVREALAQCEFVVVSDCYAASDTLRYADVALPASSWSEKHGTVTNSERCISLQKGMTTPPGQVMHDWQIICHVAAKMGFQNAFDYRHPVEIFREHACLSGFKNAGTRCFDISGLEEISRDSYDNFTPIRWPVNTAHPAGCDRLFSNGKYFTGNGKAQLLPINAALPALTPGNDTLILNTGRLRDQWHTMTRTGRASRLFGHQEEPTLTLHPKDAAKLSICEGELLRVSSEHGHVTGRALISDTQRSGEVFLPIHWTDQFSSSAIASSLIGSQRDPLSGQPQFKQTAVTVQPLQPLWSGVLLSSSPVVPKTEYWAKVRLTEGYRYFAADSGELPDQALLTQLRPDITDWIYLQDSAKGFFRAAGFVADKLACVLFCELGEPDYSSINWLDSLLGQALPSTNRYQLLSGKPADASKDIGNIICSCFQIGSKQIIQALESGECDSPQSLGEVLKCGTNCGSCLPELKAMVKSTVAELAS